jgi:hypothetical protein
MTSRVSLLSSTAIAAAALVFAGAPSSAASLDALEKRVKALEKSGAGKAVSRAKKSMNFKISGQINRAIQHADNGLNSEIRHVTNTNSQNKLRFTGTGKISDDLKIMAYAELGNNDSGSSSQSVSDADVGNNTGFATTRYMELRLTSKSMGKLYLGHGSDAQDGVVGAGNLSGLGVAMSGGMDEDLQFADEDFVTSAGALINGGGVKTASTDSVGTQTTKVGTKSRVDTYNDEFDGTRQDRIRYDTPSFGGFKVAVSHANNDRVSYSLRYGGNFNGIKVKGAIGKTDQDAGADGSGNDETAASIGVLLPMGLNVQYAYGERSRAGRNDPEANYVRVGYRMKNMGMGETRVGVSLHQVDDGAANGDDWQSLNFAVVQVIEPLGAELYGAYSNVSLDRTATANIEDIDIVTVGLRVNF